MLGVCRGWGGALAAAPHLMPTVTFRGPAIYNWAAHDFYRDYQGAAYLGNIIEADHASAAQALTRLAAVRTRSRRWRLEGCKGQVSSS